jgi:predicted nucleic acid-binding protein
MMSKLLAVDTNILVYLHDTNNQPKRRIAVNILFQRPKVPSQVLSEYLNVTRKLLPLTKEGLLAQTARLFARCEIINITKSTLQLASELIKAYRFQLFDAISWLRA